MRNDPRLNNWIRHCAFCKQIADGSWGTFDGNIPPETGELYTCVDHWDKLYAEAEASDGDPVKRPMFAAGLYIVGMFDLRNVQDFPELIHG